MDDHDHAGLESARAKAKGPIGPWVANLITHSTNTRFGDDLELVRRHKPIVITALGSPKPALQVVHDYGGLVFADVVNLNLARKAAAAGVDGLACISAGAGGHTGHLSAFAFISAVREFFDGWIVVGGGIADGAGIAGAIAAGADFVYMGTRFLPSLESRAVQQCADGRRLWPGRLGQRCDHGNCGVVAGAESAGPRDGSAHARVAAARNYDTAAATPISAGAICGPAVRGCN